MSYYQSSLDDKLNASSMGFGYQLTDTMLDSKLGFQPAQITRKFDLPEAYNNRRLIFGMKVKYNFN